MKKSIIRFYVLNLLGLLLITTVAACSPIRVTEATITALVSTETRITESQTPPTTPSPFPTVTPAGNYQQIIRKCARIVQSELPISGVLQLTTTKQGQESHDYFLNMETGAQTLIEGWIGYSPDESRYIYRNTNQDSYVVADRDGKVLRELHNVDEKLGVAGWLDNQRVILDKRRTEYGDLSLLHSLIIWNVVTGEQEEWIPESLPNIEFLPYIVKWWSHSRLILNPKYRVLIYPADEDGHPAILWNMDSQTEIARIIKGNRLSPPEWSPDGEQFVISAPPRITGDGIVYKNIDDGLPHVRGNDLFLVSHDGEIKRLTYFSVDAESWQENVSWSPNAQRIAFLSQVGDFYGEMMGDLSVVDVNTGVVTNYCINGYVVWTDDDRYVFVTEIDHQNIRTYVYLLDLETGEAWKVADDVQALRWFESLP